MFTTLFCIASGISLVALFLSAMLQNTVGKIFGYLSIPVSAAAIILSAVVWRKLEVTLLCVMSLLLIYLLISCIRLAIDRRKRGEEAPRDI